jgi:hypothetical protein
MKSQVVSSKSLVNAKAVTCDLYLVTVFNAKIALFE